MKLFCRAFGMLGAVAAFGADQPTPLPDIPLPPPPMEASPAAAPSRDPEAPMHTVLGAKVKMFVIEVKEEIGAPVLYIIRKGVKEAMDGGADIVIVDMDTLGGELGATLEIMEILGKFKGRTITYVNDKAVSAGAFISAATQDIYFAPRATIGAAAAVSSSGEDIEKTMKEKIRSFLSARIRAISEGRGYRADVVTAMMDMDFEFKIGDVVINPKGKLLTLTANEAMKTYGEPPQPLFGAGIAESLTELQQTLAGGRAFEVRTFEVTWSIKLFRWFNAIGPVLIALGLMGIVLEFQVGGHGWMAGCGVALLLLVFVGYNTAGLSGHEPMLVFLLGVVLIIVDILLFPGTFIAGTLGLMLVLGSLVWAMADIWPNEPISFSGDLFVQPLTNLGFALVIAGVGTAVLMRFLPRSSLFQRLAISHAVAGAAQIAGGAPEAGGALDELIGRSGVAVSGLYPSGQIEIEGRRYEARVIVGSVRRGETVVVKACSDFGVIVEAMKS